ncbi:dihydropteroate synthase [Pseudomonas aeruginosa]|nr:dihydropteroate synthase [Pseudomonas aeruginosa]BAP53319.1 dihydropteroate synthase [Pseudomonas aeruginosa]
MSNPQYPTRLPCGSRVLDLARPHVMGILNVTPDSFSDGGRYDRLDDALRHAERMVREGATLIDVGGESTRPGARSVSPTEELERVAPVVERIARELDVVISVDTSTPAVMRETARLGAGLINDVRSLQRDGALDAAVEAAWRSVSCTCAENRRPCRMRLPTRMWWRKSARSCRSVWMPAWRPESTASGCYWIRVSVLPRHWSTTWCCSGICRRSMAWACRCWSAFRARA